MTEEEIATRHIWVPKVRRAIKDRAAWLLFIYRSLGEALPAEEVERHLRQAIRKFGHYKGRNDGPGFSARRWIDGHEEKGSAEVFSSKLVREEGSNEQQMGFCPLIELWREEGCTQEEIELLCDIAMEGDRGRAEEHDLEMELSETIARGASRCRLILSDRRP